MVEQDKKIYTVQVAYVNPDGSIKRHRNWGFYYTLQEAEEVIINNYTDIYENCYYNYGIINEAVPGIIMNHKYITHWYKTDYDNMLDDHNPSVAKCESPIPKNHRMGLDW